MKMKSTWEYRALRQKYTGYGYNIKLRVAEICKLYFGYLMKKDLVSRILMAEVLRKKDIK